MKQSSELGLSLIEVVISTCILSILVLPVMNLVITNIKTNSSASDSFLATSIAENKVESLKASNVTKNYKSEVSNIDGFTVLSVIDYLKDDSENADIYKIRVEVRKHNKLLEEIITYKSNVRKSK